MAEHELELRLQAVARALDADAPAFDPASLRVASRRRLRESLAVLGIVAALAGVVAAPAAVSGLRDLFGVDEVSELGPVASDVAPPFAGKPVPPNAIQEAALFRVRMISSLGAPDAAYVRDDITGAMATIVYEEALLTQWRAADVDARLSVVKGSGAAEDVKIGGLPGLWIEGTARGTFTLVGADGAIHRERFEVGGGLLLWKDDGIAFLLQGVAPKAKATLLAAEVDS